MKGIKETIRTLSGLTGRAFLLYIGGIRIYLCLTHGALQSLGALQKYSEK